MQNSVIVFLLWVTLAWGTEAKNSPGCVIPESGPQRGILPKGCDVSKQAPALFNEFQVRCKVTDVRCDSKIKGGYLAVAKVDQWLKGSGPTEVVFRFSDKRTILKEKTQNLKAGKGLCADLTLEKRADDWVLLKVENPTSSSDVLPTCP